MALPELRPEDRVLLTAPLDQTSLRKLAALLAQGRLVVLAEGAQLASARRECLDLENLMITPGSRDEIPWRTHSFDVILDPKPDEPSHEMLRVLYPGGRILPPG